MFLILVKKNVILQDKNQNMMHLFLHAFTRELKKKDKENAKKKHHEDAKEREKAKTQQKKRRIFLKTKTHKKQNGNADANF